MVLDLLFNVNEIEIHPLEMFLYSIITSILSGIFALIIFSEYASIVFPFLISLSLLPAFHRILQDQEIIEEEFKNMKLRERYSKIIEIYGCFFLGVMFGVILLITFLPAHWSSTLFSEQTITINEIRNGDIQIQGKYYALEDNAISILTNNIKVLFIAFILSFFFGSGAIFILSWNASVVGTFVAEYAREISQTTNIPLFLAHLHALMSISLHGIPEVLGYFIGGISGGVLSFGLLYGKNRKIIMFDSIKLLGIATTLIIIAAMIEGFIVPLL